MLFFGQPGSWVLCLSGLGGRLQGWGRGVDCYTGLIHITPLIYISQLTPSLAIRPRQSSLNCSNLPDSSCILTFWVGKASRHWTKASGVLWAGPITVKPFPQHTCLTRLPLPRPKGKNWCLDFPVPNILKFISVSPYHFM